MTPRSRRSGGPARLLRAHRSLAALVVFVSLLGACRTTRVDPGGEVPVAAREAFLDTLQERTFRWFWETTNPETGLVPDRWPSRDFSSIAAIGFGLTAYGVAAERGYVSRKEAAARTLTTLRFLWTRPQGPAQVGVTGYRGFFYHFLEYDSGARFRGTELSTIDTALLMAGVLFAREYFDADDPDEAAIRATADSLYQRVEWDWFRKEGEVRITMGWHPETDFGRARWEGYNEAMLLYVLALGSPTFPIGPEAWDAWTSTYEWNEFYGHEHVDFSPLFGHQYSHVWIDFRGIADAYMRGKGIDYFENSRRATLSQRAYAIDNPMGWEGYGEDVWGLTACDGPVGAELEYEGETRRFWTYHARGASTRYTADDGTIAPTATGGSIPFAPEVTIAALMTMRDRWGDRLWTKYGFRDAFNPSFTFAGVQVKPNSAVTEAGWFDHDYLGIDQGPILLMAENHRTGLVWEVMRRSPYVVRGLERAGFTGGWLDEARVEAVERIDFARQPDRSVAEADARLVVVLGSSTAQGTGPEKTANTWVNRFRAWLETVDPAFDVLNLARGGYTTHRLLPAGAEVPEGRPEPDPLRNVDAALARDPVAIVVSAPSNDAAAGIGVAEQMRNFESIVARAEAAGVPVWVTTSLPRSLPGKGRRIQIELRDAILERYGNRAIDFWTGFATADGGQDPRWNAGDGIHYDDEAHRVFFERVKEVGIPDAVMEPALQE